jgi:ubiquinone/menaquinone biosynthesis C-methylase UbiE
MTHLEDQENANEYYAETYDDSVGDWPGEIDFYLELVRNHSENVLEIAAGTGRVSIRLSQSAEKIIGLDQSLDMINHARRKSTHIKNIQWEQADMRDFMLSEKFSLILIPGHSFQNLRTSQDQVACLQCVRQHLKPGGLFVMHLDQKNMQWLGDLCGEKGGAFESAETFSHPETGNHVQASHAWTYEPASQTATVQSKWEENDKSGEKIRTITREKIPLHTVFPFEIEHLLARVGLEVEAVYGNFFKHGFTDQAENMIWVAKNPC